MHGLIFAAFRGYLEEARGPELAWEALGERAYVIHESHADEFFMESLERACALLDVEPDALLEDFGVFTGRKVFPRLFPMMYSPHISASSFLPVVDEQIHSIVRKAAPGALTPGLAVHREDGGVMVAYTSARKLCVYLRGLLQGTAAHFGETAKLEEETCMRRADPVCLFRVQLSQKVASASEAQDRAQGG